MHVAGIPLPYFWDWKSDVLADFDSDFDPCIEMVGPDLGSIIYKIFSGSV